MALQNSGWGVSLWRLIAGIGIGVELVTIDTYLSRTGAEIDARPAPSPSTRRSSSRWCRSWRLIAYQLVPISPFGFDGWRWVVVIGSIGALFVWFGPPILAGKPALADQSGTAWTRLTRVTSAIEAKVLADLKGAPLPAPGRPCGGEGRAARPAGRDLRAALSQPHRHADGVPVLPDLRLLRFRRLGADFDRSADRHQSRRQPALFVHHRHREPVRPIAGDELRRHHRAQMAAGRRRLLRRNLRHACSRSSARCRC